MHQLFRQVKVPSCPCVVRLLVQTGEGTKHRFFGRRLEEPGHCGSRAGAPGNDAATIVLCPSKCNSSLTLFLYSLALNRLMYNVIK